MSKTPNSTQHALSRKSGLYWTNQRRSSEDEKSLTATRAIPW